jgi:heat shock protein HslJ
MKNIVLFTVIFFIAAIASCSNSKKTTAENTSATVITDENKLNGNWQLTYMSGVKITLDGLFPNKKPTLVIKLPSPGISGNGGCNGYGGEVKIEGKNISFGKIMHTMMACGGITGENQFFAVLETATTYSVHADTSLILLKGDIAVMRFVKK